MKELLVILFAVLFASATWADDAHHPKDARSTGEVRKVDRDAKKLTIKHGPLRNLDMPAMTMVYQVKDSAMLDRLKSGDKVRFEAQNVGGTLTVTAIEKAN